MLLLSLLLYRVVLTIRKIEKEILASNGHVLILATRSGDPANTNVDGMKHPNREVYFFDQSFEVPFGEGGGDKAYHMAYSLSSSTKAKIKQFNPTVMHMTGPDFTALALIDFARKENIPLMGTYHSNYVDYLDHYPGIRWLKPLLRNALRFDYSFFQTLYVPTPFIKQHIMDSLEMHKCTDIQIWGRGIDITKFSPKHRSQEFRLKYGIESTDVVICFVGRLVIEKRLDIFAEVIQRLQKKEIKFKAIVVGSGPSLEILKNLPNTILTGWLNGSDLSMAYASSDIFLFPSSVETFGNVTLEAAASGLPLIVERKCSGHLVDETQNPNGYLCDENDVDAYYKATLSLIEDSEKRKCFSKNSRQLSLSYELHVINKQMIENYRKTIDQFFDKYKGKHQNRDLEWEDTGFPLGTLPRPLIFIISEYAIIMFLCTAFKIWVIFSSTKDNSTTKTRQNKKSTYNFKWLGRILTNIGDGPVLLYICQIFAEFLVTFFRTGSMIEIFVMKTWEKLS